MGTVVDWISVVISAIGTVSTIVLTIIIICQTGDLNEKQQELEARINRQQEELQKRQLKMDIYPYKREVYVNVFAILSFCNFLTKSFTEDFLVTKSCEEIEKMYKTLQASYVPDTEKTLWSLREAEYIFSKETADVILDIRNNFDKLGSRLIAASTVSKVVLNMGADYQDRAQDIKQMNIHTALECSKKILSYTDYIEKHLPKELRIVDVDK